MLAKRIIPCLDIKDGKVVKGVNFKNVQSIADPVEMAQLYNNGCADELVFYDITASSDRRTIFYDLLMEVASQIYIPLMVGGGISELDDFSKVLNCGADKVSVNSSAIVNPAIIEKAAYKFGNQCVVLSMDVKKVGNEYHVFSHGGRDDTGINALKWARQGQELGAGELVVNSIDADGVKQGFDTDLLYEIERLVSIPIVASGGAGNPKDFVTLFETVKGVDAGLAASIFHSKAVSIAEVKEELVLNNIPVRLGS